MNWYKKKLNVTDLYQKEKSNFFSKLRGNYIELHYSLANSAPTLNLQTNKNVRLMQKNPNHHEFPTNKRVHLDERK